MNAQLHTIDGKPVLRFERRLAHPPEKVWRVATDPAEMAHWFPAEVSTELKAGAAMRFSFGEDDDGTYADGEILDIDPPKVYAFRWTDEVIRIELVPEGQGCLLVFTVTLSGAGTVGDLPSIARNAPGWDGCLDALVARADGRHPPEMTTARFLDLAEHYVEEFGLAEGTVSETAEGDRIRFERDLVQPVREVWDTLAGGEEPGDGTPPLRFTHGYIDPGPVTPVEPQSLLEYAWCHGGTAQGLVRFELHEQEPIGCRLVLTQTVPGHLAELRATALAAWQTHLEVLFATLNGASRCWPEGHVERLAEMYAQRLEMPAGHRDG